MPGGVEESSSCWVFSSFHPCDICRGFLLGVQCNHSFILIDIVVRSGRSVVSRFKIVEEIVGGR